MPYRITFSLSMMYIKCYNNNYQKDKCLQEEEENCHLLKKITTSQKRTLLELIIIDKESSKFKYFSSAGYINPRYYTLNKMEQVNII